MCLLTLHPESFILPEDLIVYKILEETNRLTEWQSPYYNYRYTIGKLYKTQIRRSFMDRSCFDNIDLNYLSHLPATQEVYSYGGGFHSALNEKRLKNPELGNGLIWKCLIPAGSRVVLGVTDLIVSDKIVIIEPA